MCAKNQVNREAVKKNRTTRSRSFIAHYEALSYKIIVLPNSLQVMLSDVRNSKFFVELGEVGGGDISN
jgi:hypothetical protein